jgi:GNAT superfamily N-acetyltransferase
LALQSSPYRVDLFTTEAELEAIAKLRIEAWQANGELPSFIVNQDIRKDEHEKHGIHLAVLQNGSPVAAAKICFHETPEECPDPESLEGYEIQLLPPIATFNRLVVHPQFRRLGLSRLLTKQRIEIAKDRNCRSVVSVTEERSRMRQLESLGFERLGPTQLRYLSYAESVVYLLRL